MRNRTTKADGQIIQQTVARIIRHAFGQNPIGQMRGRATLCATRRYRVASWAVAIACLAAAGAAHAQLVPGPITPKAGQDVQKPPNIRVNVNLVSAPAVVHNANGALVLDLTEQNFRIFDNGAQQKIEGFDLGGAPLSVAIVMETSSRIEALLPAVRRTGILFTQTVLGESGDAAVIGYNDEVDQLLPFTGDHDAIERTIDKLQEGTSGARLYDALSQAVGMLRDRASSRRRVIITVAEAVDTGSEEKLGAVLREAQLANITIYSIGLSTTAAEVRGPQKQNAPISATPPGTFGLPPIPGTPQTPTTEQQRQGNVDLLGLTVWVVQHATAVVHDHPLEVATIATGGLYQSTLRDSAIQAAIDTIGGELTAQYTLSYRPTGTGAGDYHEIKVEVVNRRGLKVRSRPGYYLGPSGN
ncbi:MAG TPA: VWA domain-containing protein [Candidatus Acidoferrales bacterium]